MKIKYKIICALLLFSNIVSAQKTSDEEKIKELFLKCQKKYETQKSFALDINYKLFTNYKSTTISEEYNGRIIKKGEDYYSKIDLTEFIKLKDVYIKIDNEAKLIQIENDSEIPDQVYNLTNLLANFTVFELTSTADHWICTMKGPEITFVPYGKAIVYISKKDNAITKQILFLLQKSSFTDSKGKKSVDFPRLEIILSSPKAKVEEGLKFDIKNYFFKKNNTIVPAKQYKNYKIVD